MGIIFAGAQAPTTKDKNGISKRKTLNIFCMSLHRSESQLSDTSMSTQSNAEAATTTASCTNLTSDFMAFPFAGDP